VVFRLGNLHTPSFSSYSCMASLSSLVTFLKNEELKIKSAASKALRYTLSDSAKRLRGRLQTIGLKPKYIPRLVYSSPKFSDILALLQTVGGGIPAHWFKTRKSAAARIISQPKRKVKVWTVNVKGSMFQLSRAWYWEKRGIFLERKGDNPKPTKLSAVNISKHIERASNEVHAGMASLYEAKLKSLLD